MYMGCFEGKDKSVSLNSNQALFKKLLTRQDLSTNTTFQGCSLDSVTG